jgi:hypothetical protein
MTLAANDHNSLSSNTQKVVFTSDGSYFRRDSNLLPTNDAKNSININQRRKGDNIVNNADEINRKGNIFVFACRRKGGQRDGPTEISKSLHGPKQPKRRLTIKDSNAEEYSSDSEESDVGDSAFDDSSSESENSAEETCSEGSTELESDLEDDSLDDDSILSDGSQNSSDETDDGNSSDSSSDYSLRNKMVVDIKQRRGAFNMVLIGSEKGSTTTKVRRSKDPGLSRATKNNKDSIKASIAVYDVGSGKPNRIFYYNQEIPVMLYHSPPVFHPFKPLLVWPVGGGDILFADYSEKTYFKRKSMPTSRQSK